MKAIKIIVKVVIFLVVLLVAALLAIPLWFGPVAKSAANATVPGIVKADFSLGHLSLNPYTARFELGALNLGNPDGYPVKDAVRLGEIIVDAETMSLATDVIHIEEIAVRDLFVSLVSGGENKVLNFKQIQYNVAGGKEKYEAAQSEKEARKAMTADNPKPEAVAKDEKPSKKIIIDRLEISGLTLQLSVLPIRIPSIVLTGIGRKTGGATLEEAWRQILDGIAKSAGLVGDQLKAFGVLTGDAVKKANEAVSKATEQATKALNDATKQLDTATKQFDGAAKQISTVTERAKGMTDSVTKHLSAGTGKTTETVTKTAGAATDLATGAVSGGTKAVDAGAKAVGDGVKAAGEGAKKALDSLKSLW